MIFIFFQIPSHLFEYFARDGRVLSQWARHYETNKAAPAGKKYLPSSNCDNASSYPLELLDAVTNFSNPTGAMELQQQLFLSSVDQVIFGNTSTDIPLNPLESYDIAARETYDLHNSMLRDSYPVAFTEKNNKDDDDGGHLLLRDSSLLHLRSHNHFVSYGGKIATFEIL